MFRKSNGQRLMPVQRPSSAVFLAGFILSLAALALAVGCGSMMQPPGPPQKAVNVLYDDDCDQDIDCAVTQPVLNHWIDLGYMKVWGMVSSAHSPLGAPTLRVFRDYYGHTDLFSVGAWTPGCELNPPSPWNLAVVNKFDAGDTCAGYAGCVAVLRQSVARYVSGGGGAHGLLYVITGPLSCEEAFRNSPPDAISTMTGAQMERTYIGQFVLMNGLVPTGTEYNCKTDAAACASFFANVTAKAGYPPVSVVPYNTGATAVMTSVPVTTLPPSNPTACAFAAQHETIWGEEDLMTVEYAVFGNTGWTVSEDSTNVVEPATGLNTWNGEKSGHYHLQVPGDQPMFEQLLSSPWLPKS